MKKPFSSIIRSPLAVVVLASMALAPVAEAAGGRDRASGGAAQGGGGGGRQTAQVNNSKADARTNNVRGTSVNNVNRNNVNVDKTNVNVDRNVNVNVQQNSGCCNNGWDNDYHPVATAVAVGTAVAVTSAVIGSIVNAPPPGCVPVNVGGMVYQQCGSTWYQPQGAQYVVVNPPL
jgi:hypothetical protein